MKIFNFDLQRFNMEPGLDPEFLAEFGFCWNTLPGAVCSGFGSYLMVNHGAGAVIYCDNVSSNVNNEGTGVRIYGSNFSDTLDCPGSNCYIDAGGGNNLVIVSGNQTRIIAGNGSDEILTGGTGNYVDAGGGNNVISNAIDVNNVKIIAGSGNDIIKNFNGNNVTIEAGAGNNDVSNFSGNNVTITTQDNDDKIFNGGHNVEIFTGGGNDFISNSGYKVNIVAPGGHNTIENNNESAKITTGDGNDSVVQNGWQNVDINVGNGNNTVKLPQGGNSTTITAGTGNDYLNVNDAHDLKINMGDGNNTVRLVGIRSSIIGGTGKDEIYLTGSDETIDAGDGDNFIELKNGYHPSTCSSIVSGKGKDTIINDRDGYGFTIESGAGADSIKNAGHGAKILAGDDEANDTVENSGTDLEIFTGKGDDSIINNGERAKIFVGQGKDTVENFKASVTINAGNEGEKIDPDSLEENVGEAVVINATASKDNIIIAGGNVTVESNSEILIVKDNSSSTLALNAGDGEDRIFNRNENVIINAGSGDDHVGNASNCVTIKTGKGDDSIYNEGDSVSIDSSDSYDEDKNFLYNEGQDVTITGGDAQESIVNKSSSVTINTAGGKNQLSLFGGENIYVTTGTGENTIIAYGDYKDNSTLVPSGNYAGSNLTIDAGGGKNLVSLGSSWSYVTLNGSGEAGAVNAIFNEATNAFLDVKTGVNLIENQGDKAFIFGGEDGDMLTNYGDKAYIRGDDGKGSRTSRDYIYTDKANDVRIDGGKDADTIDAYHDVRASISGGEGNDQIMLQRFSAQDVNKLARSTVSFLKDSVNVFLSLKGISFTFSLEVQDWFGILSSEGLKGIKILGGVKASNCIDLTGAIKSAVSAITNFYKAYADLAELLTTESTVNGGAGDDTIISDGIGCRVFEYDATGDGDGNDVYYNLKDNPNNIYAKISTIQVTGDDIDEVQVNGTNVLIKIGAGSMNLVDMAGNNFNLREADGTLTTRAYDKDTVTGDLFCSIFGGGSDDVIKDKINPENTRYVIYGGYGNDELHGNKEDDTLHGENGNDKLFGDEGDDLIYAGGGDNLIVGGKGDDTVHADNRATSDHHQNTYRYSSGDGCDVIHSFRQSDIIELTNVSIVDVKLKDSALDDYAVVLYVGERADQATGYIDLRLEPGTWINIMDATGTIIKHRYLRDSNSGEVLSSLMGANGIVTITGSDKNDYDLSGGNILSSDTDAEIRALAGNDVIHSGFGRNTLIGSQGDDQITSNGKSDLIIYNLGDGDDTVYGWGSNTTSLKLPGIKYSHYTTGDDYIIDFGNGSITIVNGKGKTINIDNANFEDTTPTWELDGNTATFGTPDDPQITLTGIKSLEGVKLDGKKVILSPPALNGETVTISGGYVLEVDDYVPTSSKKVPAKWEDDGKTYTYTEEYTPDYYKPSPTKLTYIPAKGGETFTLTGIASTTGVKVSGTKVTIGKTALDGEDITLTTDDGFTLALDKSVPAAKEIKSGWTSKKGVYTYTAPGTTEGYVRDGDTIVYTEKVGGETFTISGLKNTSDVTVEDYVVTIGAGSLNGKNVTFSGEDFEFVLGDDVPTEAEEVDGGFTSVAKGTATYRTAHTSEAYTLGEGEISYTAAVGGQDIKISNLDKTTTLDDMAGAIDIVEDDDGVQITFMDREVLTTKAPTISAPKGVKYTVAVDEELSKPTTDLQWKSKSTAATLSADTGATYTVNKNKVVYTKGKTSKPQAVLTGLANTNLATPEENVITLEATNLGTKTSLKSNAGGYAIELTGDMAGKTFVGSTGADTIDVAADNALVDGGKGNDEFNISGASVTIISSAGNDTTNFADGLTVSLSGTTTVKELEQSDSGVQLTFSNKATLMVAEVTDTFDVIGKKQNFTVDTDKFALADSLTFSGKSVTVAADFTGAITPDDDIYLGGKLSTVTTIDASAVTEGISIEGNAKANVIYGGEGDDTLWGGLGNDTLIGGDGSDTFIFGGEGKDVVRGFSDDDLLEIVGNFTTSYNSSKNEIALKVGKGSLTLKDFDATDFNINGETYQISGNKLAK